MKTTLLKLVATGALAYGVAACGTKEKAAESTAVSTEASAAPTGENTPAAESAAPAATTATAAAASPDAAFDLSTVPVSTADLGTFPYVGPLKGYAINYPRADSIDYEFDRSYLYDGKNLISVEGHVLRRTYKATNNEKQASDLMIRRNYENLVTSLGGVKVFSGEIPSEVIKKAGGDSKVQEGGITGYSGDYDVYVIRQKEKEVWVQLQKPGNENYYFLSVTERAAMPQQAGIIKADELKKN